MQLSGCRKQLGIVQREHEYIKDQLTTTEVRNYSRCFLCGLSRLLPEPLLVQNLDAAFVGPVVVLLSMSAACCSGVQRTYCSSPTG